MGEGAGPWPDPPDVTVLATPVGALALGVLTGGAGVRTGTGTVGVLDGPLTGALPGTGGAFTGTGGALTGTVGVFTGTDGALIATGGALTGTRTGGTPTGTVAVLGAVGALTGPIAGGPPTGTVRVAVSGSMAGALTGTARQAIAIVAANPTKHLRSIPDIPRTFVDLRGRFSLPDACGMYASLMRREALRRGASSRLLPWPSSTPVTA
jgi:hypothetical protein